MLTWIGGSFDDNYSDDVFGDINADYKCRLATWMCLIKIYWILQMSWSYEWHYHLIIDNWLIIFCHMMMINIIILLYDDQIAMWNEKVNCRSVWVGGTAACVLATGQTLALPQKNPTAKNPRTCNYFCMKFWNKILLF